MDSLIERLDRHPIVPYIRVSGFAVRKPWRMSERRLLDYLFVYIKEGTLRVVVDGVSYWLEAGQFCLVQPNCAVMLEAESNTITPYVHMDLFYNPQRMNSFPTKSGQMDLTIYRHLLQPSVGELYGLEIPVHIVFKQPKKIIEKTIQMVELAMQYDPVMQLQAQLLAYEIIVAMLEAYIPGGSGTRSGADPLKWIVAYFSTHISEPLSIQMMADRANLSVSRFSALFKQRYRMSPHRYLLQMRVDYAKELLESSTSPQEAIAEYCGFSDVHHFSKMFKKFNGSTPGEWRNQHSRLGLNELQETMSKSAIE